MIVAVAVDNENERHFRLQDDQADHSNILSPVEQSEAKLNEKKCHGRVENIEEMVPPNWWQSVFSDELYLKTDGDVVEDPEITKDEIKLLASFKEIAEKLSKKSGKVLDLCCGQGRHSIQLAHEYPELSIFGYDQSSFLIDLAKKRAAKISNEISTFNAPTFTVGDCRNISFESNFFDAIFVMGNSFGYFKQDEGQLEALKEIHRVLAPGGILVLDLTDGDYMKQTFSPRSWEWIDDQSFVCRERSLSKDGKRLISREVICDTNRGVIRDQFYQERLYSEHELWNEILKPCGFEKTQVKEEKLRTGIEMSKRNEDLGMMACRMLVICKKPSSEPLSPLESPAIDNLKIDDLSTVTVDNLHRLIPKLTVIMGDPTLSCVGKLNNTWNKEDLETRQKLYDALNEINFKGDNFAILENHNDLVETVFKQKPQFVFNLCDEGFKNVATSELHVPALLEMCCVNYSGAGPQCLAFCYDKQLTNRVAKAIGVPVPEELFVNALEISIPGSASYNRIKNAAKYPSFIKPIEGDNSLGITIKSLVKNFDELKAYILDIGNQYSISEFLVQEYLPGPEFSVGVIGNNSDDFQFLPVLQVDFSGITSKGLPPILGFESKWDPSSPYWTDIKYQKCDGSSMQSTPSNFSQLQQYCAALFERFGCRDFARFDFRCDERGEIKLLEVNPNPGWCWDGKLNKMASFNGWSYSRLIGEIIKAAYLRLQRENKL